jgi:hypothetical protein
MRKTSRPVRRCCRAALALAAALAVPSCTQVRITGLVYEDDGSFTPLPGTIVTYTSTTSNVTFNDTTLTPSGMYEITLPEDSYLIQAVHPTCNSVTPVINFMAVQANSPYTVNLAMTCP